MKTKSNFGRLAMLLLLAVVLFLGIGSCKQKGTVSYDPRAPDPNGGCEVVEGSDGLYNCNKNKCATKCMMQYMNKGKKWRDIPGGNVNPKDVPEGDSIRCVCDTSKKKMG